MVIPRCRSRSMESIVAPTLSLPRTWLENKDEYQTTKSNSWIYWCIFLEQRICFSSIRYKKNLRYTVSMLWSYSEIMYLVSSHLFVIRSLIILVRVVPWRTVVGRSDSSFNNTSVLQYNLTNRKNAILL